VSHASGVDAAALAALGRAPVVEASARHVVISSLASRRALLIVDNCEHVLEASAELVVAVLRACPEVHVLITSRRALGIPGERTFALAPRAPDDQVTLFRQRAVDRRDDAHLDRQQVADVCTQLDGMPLAIQLAAARLRSMSLVDLGRRLDERLRLLTGGRAADPRHRTLGTFVDWSFAQLDPARRV
jgi:predicted ATPase